MALKVRTSKPKTYEYIPISERGEEKPFTVEIRQLSKREYAVIEDKLARFHRDESITFSSMSTNYELVQQGLVGWKNMFDDRGKPIEPVIKNGVVDAESLDLLPIEIIQELANVIAGITKDPDNADIYLGIDKEMNDVGKDN
jgi:hypothetical protein